MHPAPLTSRTSKKQQHLEEYYRHRKGVVSGAADGGSSNGGGPLRKVLRRFLGMGVMKVSLAAVLPFALFAARLHFVSSSLSASKVIEVPPNFCELDRRDECEEGQCLRYDPKKFKEGVSVVTYFPGGRLGNMLTAFLTSLWVHLDHGLDPYLEKEAHDFMSVIFEHVDAIKVLETDLCDWRQFPFQKYEGDVELLGRPEWRVGKAIQIHIDKKNYMRHEIQGGRKYYKKFRKQSMSALSFRERFRKHAQQTLEDVAKRYRKRKNLGAKTEVTFVGVHNRRTDYLEFRRKRLGLDNLYEDYFEDAMDYYREEHDHPVFLYVSDDMKWGLENLKSMADGAGDVFFVGCGDGDDTECIGKDFAVLAHCNHTITTHGSFGHWASYFAGGEIYTEYGAIVPDAYV